MIGRLWRAWRSRKARRERASFDALKVRYHTFRILLANNERALARLGKIESALASGAADELTSLVEDLLAVTFEMVDGVARLVADGSNALYARQLRLEEELRAALEMVEEGGRGPSCLPLAQPLDVGEVGGKAAGLSLLLRNGFPVPDGFAVTARACREFLHETGLDSTIRQRLRAALQNEAGLGAACDAIRRDILAAPLPEWLAEDLRTAAARLTPAAGGETAIRLAARSSALTEDRPEHSFAGQYTTELNLTPQDLEQGFSKVMAGAFSERAVVYRQEVGLPVAALDMAVLVQRMVAPRAAGVAFTIDPVHPQTERMLVTAVPGLGILAVNGSVPVDIFRVARDEPTDIVSQLARKTRRAMAAPDGLIRREAVPSEDQHRPVLAAEELARLARLGLAAEALAGSFCDLEYAVDGDDRIWLLQSRPARVAWGGHRPAGGAAVLYHGGMPASPGRCLGCVRHVTGEMDGMAPTAGPVIALLPTAAPEAARWLARWRGIVVAGGNPADHLSTVARELGRPMLTRATGAMAAVPDGALVVLDAGEGLVTATHAAIGDIRELLLPATPAMSSFLGAPLSPARARVRDRIVPLTVGDAKAPTFSVNACHTLHDIIRYAHEMAVLSLFKAEDDLLEAAAAQVRILRGDIPFAVMVIDLGGGLREDVTGRDIGLEAVVSLPLAALWRGMTTPGLYEPVPQEATALAEPGTKRCTDASGRRAVDQSTYALTSRDYVNVNARMPSHATMIDAVCGPRARGNYARLRFTGRGKAAVPLWERRAVCLEHILQAGGFFVSRQHDRVTASLADAPEEVTAEALKVLGRLLGFVRFLDAAMTDDAAPQRLAEAFWAEDSGLRQPGTVAAPREKG